MTLKEARHEVITLLTEDHVEVFETRSALHAVVEVSFEVALRQERVRECRDVDAHDCEGIPAKGHGLHIFRFAETSHCTQETQAGEHQKRCKSDTHPS